MDLDRSIETLWEKKETKFFRSKLIYSYRREKKSFLSVVKMIFMPEKSEFLFDTFLQTIK